MGMHSPSDCNITLSFSVNTNQFYLLLLPSFYLHLLTPDDASRVEVWDDHVLCLNREH